MVPHNLWFKSNSKRSDGVPVPVGERYRVRGEIAARPFPRDRRPGTASMEGPAHGPASSAAGMWVPAPDPAAAPLGYGSVVRFALPCTIQCEFHSFCGILINPDF